MQLNPPAVALLRDGGVIAEGSVREVLSEERLAALYEAPVATVREPGGRTAFLPG